MAAPRRSGRSRFVLIFMALITVTLLTLDARNFSPLERVKDGVAGILSPLRGGADSLFSPLGSMWKGITDYDDLEAENEALRAELDANRANQILNEDAAVELEELKKQLGLQGLGGIETVAAEVTANGVSNFDGFVVEIDKGTRNGLRTGMPVVTDGGLVGRIEDARARRSTVRLITDPNFAVGVRVVGSEDVALATGQGEGQPLVIESGIPVTTEISVGDVVVTAGVSRSLYPEELAVGTVVAVSIDETTLEYRLLVSPSASTTRVSFVTVLLYDPDQVDTDSPAGAGNATATPDQSGDSGADSEAEDGGS